MILALTAFNVVSAYSQNSTNSPYSRFGYGRLSDHSIGTGRSMGGTGIGLRSSRQINPMNPASYSSIDTMTFLFDFGTSAQMSWFNDGTNKQHNINGNVEYMAMQFPLHRQIAMSAGLLPLSSVGYSFINTGTSDDDLSYTETYVGTGGINQLYAGFSFDVWKKRLAVGANLNYLFGSTNHLYRSNYNSNNPTSVYTLKILKVNDINLDFGLQYTQPVNKSDRWVTGLTYSPRSKLNNENIHTIESTESISDTIKNNLFELPAKYGLGFTYVRDNKFIIAADVSYQEWSKIKFNSLESNFNNRTKIAAGMEFIPNLYSRPFYNRMKYRAGLNYANSYIKINGKGYKELGVSLGVGIPVSDNRSFVNFSIEYMKILPEAKSMISEDYARITLSYTFNELWFIKQKLD
ncbi:MAG: outer membrane protein transport protein [Tannerella sp.]|nr:outer membrane protein transport protein [Tannerella sp.]